MHIFSRFVFIQPVDGDEVPVPHTGLALTVEQFHELADRLRQAGIEFIIEPHLRFEGQPGEQYTMFFKVSSTYFANYGMFEARWPHTAQTNVSCQDPSGNNLEFKAMTKPENLFAKYNVVDNKNK